MRQNVIPVPVGSKVADERTTEQLLPFTYTISAFRRSGSFGSRGLTVQYKQQAAPYPASRPPSDSYISITYSFTSNESLRDQYQRFSSPFLRVGLLLEDLDSFAADVASRHLGGLPHGMTVVTAAIERVAFTSAGSQAKLLQRQSIVTAVTAVPAAASGKSSTAGFVAGSNDTCSSGCACNVCSSSPAAELSNIPDMPLSICNDLHVAGQVCWAGRSSMEVLLELSTATPPPKGKATGAANSNTGGSSQQAAELQMRWAPRALAHFVMVLRPRQDAPLSTVGLGHVPKVVPSTAQEQQHYDTAAERADMYRAKRANKSVLSGQQPTPDEVSLLYHLAEEQLLRQTQQREEHERSSTSGMVHRPVTLTPVPISQTEQSHLAIMHRQDRNNANNIFGGHLLRLAAELAYSTAVLHAGRHCEAVALGDVTFRQPVPIGCVLEFKAKVVYTSGNLMRVTVVATKHQQLLERPLELHASVTNDFTFVLAAVGSYSLRAVAPNSLREALQYVAAHRQHLADGYQAPELLQQQGMEHVLVG